MMAYAIPAKWEFAEGLSALLWDTSLQAAGNYLVFYNLVVFFMS